MTPQTRIDRLTIHAGQLSELEARRLARLVAECLADFPIEANNRERGSFNIDAHPEAGATLTETARALAASVAAAIQQPGATS